MRKKKSPFKVYKPKMYTEEDIHSGWKSKGKTTEQSNLDAFGLKMNKGKKRSGGLNLPNPLGMKQEPQQEPEQEEEEEPFWSAEEWEDWAISMYENVKESRKYLPEWVVEVMEGNE